MLLSSNRLGHRPFTAIIRIQVPSGVIIIRACISMVENVAHNDKAMCSSHIGPIFKCLLSLKNYQLWVRESQLKIFDV